MEQRIKIKHTGARGWAGIAASAFDPAKHERFDAPKSGRAPEQADDMQSLRAEYKALTGKRPFMGWDADQIAAKMAEAAE